MKVESNISAPTKFVQVGNERYAYRRFGNGSGLPLLFLQHFTGTQAAHGEHEKRTGQRDANWPDWYASYMAAEQTGADLPQ